MVITQICRKKIGGSPCLFKEILFEISLKWAFFALFPGEPGVSFTKVGLNRTNFNLSD